MPQDYKSLNDVAAQISELTQSLTKLLEDGNVTQPSFAADSVTRYDGLNGEMFMTRQKLIDAITDMWFLTQGPSESIFNYAHSVSQTPFSEIYLLANSVCVQAIPDASTLNILNYFDFWAAVPLDGTATYGEISQKVRLPEDVVYRLLQHAVNLRIFAEVEAADGTKAIAHNSRSAAMAKSSGLRGLVSCTLDDAGAPVMLMHESLRRFNLDKPKLTENIDETAFALLHKNGPYGNHTRIWDFVENDGEGERKGWRQRQVVEFMKYLKALFNLDGIVADAQDWKAAGAATVVDVSTAKKTLQGWQLTNALGWWICWPRRL